MGVIRFSAGFIRAMERKVYVFIHAERTRALAQLCLMLPSSDV